MSDCNITLRHSPLLGEHNAYVLGDLLGLSEMEMDELGKKDIILK
jgi:hypothetical protein